MNAIQTKQISEHKFKRIWEQTPAHNRSYRFNVNTECYTITCVRDGMIYTQEFHMDKLGDESVTDGNKLVKCKRKDYTKTSTGRRIFEMLYEEA